MKLSSDLYTIPHFTTPVISPCFACVGQWITGSSTVVNLLWAAGHLLQGQYVFCMLPPRDRDILLLCIESQRRNNFNSINTSFKSYSPVYGHIQSLSVQQHSREHPAVGKKFSKVFVTLAEQACVFMKRC